MIRALLLDDATKPLRMAEYLLPTLAPGEMLVKVDLATVCGSDWHTMLGKRIEPTPCVLGHEAVGTIEAMNGELAGLNIGDRVVWSVMASCGRCFYCSHDLPQKCEHLNKYGHAKHDDARGPLGSFASHVHLWPGTAVVKVPSDLPDEVAAPASCATATVEACLEKIRQAETVLVLGCGLLGLTACAMLHARGSTVFAIDSDPKRQAIARSFGASEDALPSRGVDAVLEFTGSTPATLDAIAKLRIGGTLVLAGAVAPSPPLNLEPQTIVRRCLSIHGVHNYHPRNLERAVAFLSEHHSRYPFRDLVDILPEPMALESQRQCGPLAVRHAIRFSL